MTNSSILKFLDSYAVLETEFDESENCDFWATIAFNGERYVIPVLRVYSIEEEAVYDYLIYNFLA